MKEQKENLMVDVDVEGLKECIQVYKSLSPRLRERGIGGLYMLKAAQDAAAMKQV